MPRLALLALFLLTAAGCDSGTDAVGITGAWEGSLTNTSGVFDVEVTLRDTGSLVTGAGRVGLTDGPFAFSVTNGTFANGVARLDILFEGTPPTGQINATLTQTDPGVLEGTFQARGDANGTLRIELVSR